MDRFTWNDWRYNNWKLVCQFRIDLYSITFWELYIPIKIVKNLIKRCIRVAHSLKMHHFSTHLICPNFEYNLSSKHSFDSVIFYFRSQRDQYLIEFKFDFGTCWASRIPNYYVKDRCKCQSLQISISSDRRADSACCDNPLLIITSRPL